MLKIFIALLLCVLKEPVYVKPWTGTVLDATKEGPSCIQHDNILQTFRGVEDCLRVNIYTHEVNPNELKPVMVWIHGGGFNTGSGNGESDFCGPNYLLDRDIVLVTINYRLGALGFFTTEDAEAPGNYGLIDQSLALRWVKDHIRNFGGNPDSVTIFGESAGGASVEYQILSPYSKGLFHRAIAQSGSTLCPWALSQSRYSQMFVQEMNCESSSSKEVMACLRSKPAAEIISFNEKTKSIGPFPFDVFTPRIDIERESPFLPAHPKELIEQKRFNAVPYISGMNANEGILSVAPLVAAQGKLMRKFESDPIKYTKNMISAELRADGNDIAKRLNDQYFTKGKKFEEQLTEMEKMFSDTLFFKPIQDAVDLFSKYSEQPVYYYELGHIVENGFAKLFGVSSEVLEGVCHADELGLIFSSRFIPTITTPGDIKVSKIILDLWTSFAKNGVPESVLLPSNWLPLEANTSRHLKIHATQPAMVNEPMAFYERLSALEGLFHYSSTGKDEL